MASDRMEEDKLDMMDKHKMEGDVKLDEIDNKTTEYEDIDIMDKSTAEDRKLLQAWKTWTRRQVIPALLLLLGSLSYVSFSFIK